MKPLSLTLTTTFFLLLLAANCCAQKPAPATNTFHFVANSGQLVSMENGAVVSDLLFRAATPGGDLYITTSGISYVFYRLKNRPVTPKEDQHYEVERVDLVFDGATIRRGNILTTSANTGGVYRQLKEDGKVEEMRMLDKIVIRDIYPAIDWVLYIDPNNGQPRVKQDFVLRPGADTRSLQFHYSRNARLQADSVGALSVRSRLGTMAERGLLVLERESGKRIVVQPVVRRNGFTYHFPQHIIQRETVIDPVLYWGTALSTDVTAGVNNNDMIAGNDVETDGAGNIYTLLTIGKGISFPTVDPGNGAYYQDFASAPNGGMVIMKFTPGGVLLWSTFYTVPSGVSGVTLALDPAGNLYVAAQVAVVVGNLLLEFSPGGQLLWSTYWGQYTVTGKRMVCDSKGNLYFMGVADWNIIPHVDPGGGAYKEDQHFIERAFITEFSAAHQIVWSTQLDGSPYVQTLRMAMDGNDNLYTIDDSVRCFNPAHQQVWKDATVGWPYLEDIAVDRHGNVFVVGFGPATIPKTDPGGGAFIDNSAMSGISTGFIIEYNSAHQIFWSTPFFYSAMTDAYRIVCDQRCDAVHITGVLNWFPYLFPTTNSSCPGGFYYSSSQTVTAYAPLFVDFSTSGRLLYSSLSNFPYNYYDQNLSVAGDAQGNLIYLFGRIYDYSPIPAIKDPGAGAFYRPSPNGLALSAFLMKMLPSPLDANLATTPPSGCNCNGTATVTVNCGTPPYVYQWSNGETTPTISNLCRGRQTVTVSDANCNEKTFTIDVPPAPGSIVDFTAAAQTSYCKKDNGMIQVTAVNGGTGPFRYSIDGNPEQPNADFGGLKPGNHFVRVSDVNGCSYGDSVMVTETAGPDDILMTPGAASCDGNDGTLRIDGVHNGTAGFQYSIDGQALTAGVFFTGLTTGDHQVLVQDAAGCQLTQMQTIAQSVPASKADWVSTANFCGQSDGTVTVGNITGGTAPFSYALTPVGSGGSASYVSEGRWTTLVAGDYTLSIKDSKNCELKQVVSIGAIPGPTGISLSVTNALCGAPYGAVEAKGVQGGTAPFTFSLDGTAYSTDAKLSSLPPAGYRLWARDSAGCEVSQDFSIIATAATPVTIAPADTTVCYGEKILFRGKVNGGPALTELTWNGTPASASGFAYKAEGNAAVVLLARNTDDCVSTDTAWVKVNYCDITGGPCVHVPTAFSPNGDGLNDGFGAVAHCPVQEFTLAVFDRWGTEVFATTQIDAQWDGRLKGKPAPTGGYAWVCTYMIGKVETVQKGTVLLVR